MALALKDRVKETTIVVGTGAATLLGSSIGFQPFSVVGNGNTTYYCISDQFGSNWEVGIGTYSSSGNTLARTTVLASSNGGALVVFTAGVKDVFVTYPAEKGVWLDASNNAIGLGTPAAFVGTNITGTASGLTAGNVTTNANLTGAVTSVGNASSLGSFTSLQLATALTDETGSGSAVFATSPTLANPTYTGTLTGSTGILNIGSGQLYKDASGNVGIGTSSPGYLLNVSKNGSGGDSAQLARFTDTNTSNSIGPLHLTIGAANHFAFSPSPVLCGTNGIALGVGDGSNLDTQRRLTIDVSGNVGIGTNSPGAMLHISKTAAAAPTVGAFLSNNDNTVGTEVRLGFAANTNLLSQDRYGWIGYLNTGGTNGGALTFATTPGGTPATERMRIDSSGNVLVGGHTSPTYSSKLSIYAGATTGLTYNVSAATGGSVVTNQQQSTSVSTSAVAILTPSQYASFCVVFGSDGTNRFMDLILCGLGTGTIQVVSSFTVSGSPAARTYTQSSSTYRLAMGSGTYTVNVSAITMTG